MDLVLKPTTWHIQCIHQRLETSEDVADYISDANIFVRRIWASPRVALPPKLEAAAAENCSMIYRGASTNAVRLRFRLPSKYQGDEDLFKNAVLHFCSRVFDLKAEGVVHSMIGLLTSRSLLGIAPLSEWFRFCWTRCFLDTFVHKQVPLFHDVADVDFFMPWVRGAVLMTVGVLEGNSPKMVQAIKIAIGRSLLLETRRPDRELELQSNEMSRAFCDKVEKLVRRLREAGDACSIQRTSGRDQLPSDSEVRLFDTVLEVLETGFDTLTINKKVFDQWQEIVSSSSVGLVNAGVIATGSLAVLVGGVIHTVSSSSAAGVAAGTVAAEATGIAGTLVAAEATSIATAGTVAGTTATGAVTGATASGTAIGSSLYSAAFLGPVALSLAACGFFAIKYHYHKKATKEKDRLKKLSEEISGQHKAVEKLSQWLIHISHPSNTAQGATDDNSQELQEMRTHVKSTGLTEVYTLADYQAVLESEADAIFDQLAIMKSDPELKGIFS
ncbi:hypothetical protein K458DRAFT_430987 [Lentithecium fluviatile CBS 122367]|uniref:Uncharacterized protein n=1 Tax=Lentithecium fluviatile CBS 122367 TaxID=1168545 RepID=A0A6G1J378_9PLEO|nr:hypothetical protein K458DRAFT_430987 [Lentithecium fluviatile CBS 122367]